MTILREPISRLISLWLFWRQTDPSYLIGWGTWADVVRLSHRSLDGFLSAQEAACHTDNIVVRMLLWPDDRIPLGSFIDPADDDNLIKAALARLTTFDFLGTTEDPDLELRLQGWLGRDLVIPRVNETAWMPSERRLSMQRELTPSTRDRLEHLSRLDLRLWQATVQLTIPGSNTIELREVSLRRNLDRYDAVMRG